MDKDNPPEWAIARAHEVIAVGGQPTCHVVKALARYIAEHEEAPVDPDLIEARQFAADIHSAIAVANCMGAAQAATYLEGANDKLRVVPLCLAAIKRGRELGRKVNTQ